MGLLTTKSCCSILGLRTGGLALGYLSIVGFILGTVAVVYTEVQASRHSDYYESRHGSGYYGSSYGGPRYEDVYRSRSSSFSPKNVAQIGMESFNISSSFFQFSRIVVIGSELFCLSFFLENFAVVYQIVVLTTIAWLYGVYKVRKTVLQ